MRTRMACPHLGASPRPPFPPCGRPDREAFVKSTRGLRDCTDLSEPRLNILVKALENIIFFPSRHFIHSFTKPSHYKSNEHVVLEWCGS